MIKIIQLVNKNEYEQDYNYFNIYFNSDRDYQGYKYNLSEHLYKIYYRCGPTEHNLSTSYSCESLHANNCGNAYPSAALKISNFDTMLVSAYNSVVHGSEYDVDKLLLKQLLFILRFIDEKIIMYYIQSNGITRDGSAFTKSSFININNDVSKVIFEYSVKYSTMFDVCNKHCGINIIIKSKIIDMNLLYYLIYNDSSFIQVSNGLTYFTLKNRTNCERLANLTPIPMSPVYKTDKYELNIDRGSIMSLLPLNFVRNNFKLIEPVINIDVTIEDENKSLKKQINEHEETEKRLKHEIEELKNKLNGLLKDKIENMDNETVKDSKTPKINDTEEKKSSDDESPRKIGKSKRRKPILKDSKKKKSKDEDDLEIKLHIDDA